MQVTVAAPAPNQFTVYIPGPQGPTTRWHSGAGIPAATLGIVNDWYLNTANSDVYEKTAANTWTLRHNLEGRAATDQPQTWTKAQTFAPDTDVTPLTIKSNVSQTASLTQWQNNAGTALASVNALGSFMGHSLRVGAGAAFPGEGQVRLGGASPALYFDRSGTSEYLLYDTGGSLYMRDLTNGKMLTQWVRGAAGTAVSAFYDRLHVIGGVGQTLPLQQWQNSAGTPLASVSAAGEITAPRLRLEAADDVSLTSTLHALQIGGTTNLNIVVDNNEIMARNNGVASELHINADGGPVRVGAQLFFNGDLHGNGKRVLATSDSFLRINQSSEFASGIWIGTSKLKGSSGAVYLGSNGGDAGNVEILPGTADNGARRIILDGATGNATFTGRVTSAQGGTGLRKTASFTADGWYRIASNPGSRAAAVFTVFDNASSRHNWLKFSVSRAFGTAPTVTILESSKYGTQTFTMIRVVDATTYDPAYVEVYLSSTAGTTAVDINTVMESNYWEYGWSLLDIAPGSIPTTPAGYKAYVYTVTDKALIHSGQIHALGGTLALSNAASVVTSTVRGAVSQTANLTEWQDSAGTAVARVNSGGGIRAVSFRTNTADAISAQLAIEPFNTGTVAAIIRGLTSQTADLQQWQNNAGGILANVSATGVFSTTTRIHAGRGSDVAGWQLSSTAGAAGTIGLAIRGAAGQTANLTEWQDSAGNILAAMSSVGSLAINSSGDSRRSIFTWAANDTNWRIGMHNDNTGTSGAGAGFVRTYATGHVQYITYATGVTQGFAVGPATGGLSSHFEIRASDGLAFIRNNLIVGGDLTAGNLTANYITGRHAPRFTTSNTGGTLMGQYTKIATSTISTQYHETNARVNLLQIGDGSTYETFADFVIRVKQQPAFASDPLIDIAQVDGRGLNPSDLVAIVISNAGPTVVEFWLRVPNSYQGFHGFTSENNSTAASWQWHNNAGFQAAPPAGTQVVGQAQRHMVVGIGNAFGSAMLTSRAAAASDIPLYIQGAASQSANLTQWANSAGTLVARVRSDGYFMGPGLLSAGDTGPYVATTGSTVAVYNRSAVGNVVFTVQGLASQTGDLQRWNNSASSRIAWIDNIGRGQFVAANLNGFPAGTAYLGVQTAATTVGGIIKAAASQSADLMQFQNDAGTVLARFGPDGTLYIGSHAYTGSGSIAANGVTTDTVQTITGQKTFSTSATTTPNLLVQRIASQTANLQEWRSDTGAVMARVAPDGKIYVGTTELGAPPSNYVTTDTTQTILAQKSIRYTAYASSGSPGNPSFPFVFQTHFNDGTSGYLNQFSIRGQRRTATTNDLYLEVSAPVWSRALVPGAPALVAAAAAAHTGNIQEWRDSAGNVLAHIANDGTMYKGTQVVGGNAADTEIMAIMGAF